MEQLPAKQTAPTSGLILSTIKGKLKIKFLKNEVPIRQTLLICFKLVGLREKHFPSTNPEYNERQFLIDHVRKTYPNLVADELKLAFELLVERKLNLPENQISPYDNFSPEYLGRVLNAYKEYKAKQLSKPQKTALEQPKQPTKSPLEYFENILCEQYDDLLIGKNYPWSQKEAARLYWDLTLYGFKLSHPKTTEEYSRKANVIKNNRFAKTNELSNLRQELKSELFKIWINNLASETIDIRDFIKEKTN